MERITSLEVFLSRDSTQLANTILDPCPLCGQKHTVPFHSIRLGRGALAEVADLAQSILGRAPKRAVLIYDQAIEERIHAQVIAPLRALGLAIEPFPLRGEAGHLLDSGLINGSAAAQTIGDTADLLIAAGSGVICDITKWIATQLGKPYILCGSAPSMNGYTSITATITENDIKVSKFLNPANAIVLDVDLLSTAPMRMVQSGMGDLAARAICNADWQLSHLLRKTYFCPLPYQMTAENERRYLAAAPAIAHRDPAAMQTLAEAILLSGLSMTILNGETSPSSGAEHVLSHYWDLQVHLSGAQKNFHGTQVGIATLIMLAAYQVLREVAPGSIDPRQVLRTRPSLESVEAENKMLYGNKAASFNDVARKKRIADADVSAYLGGIIGNWDAMWLSLDPYVAPYDSIRIPFDQAGVPTHLADIGRTPEQAREALLHGSHYRPRYTILDLFWELGLFPHAADEILERAGVL